MPRAHETVEVISDCSNYIPHTQVTDLPAREVKPGMLLWIPNSQSNDMWSLRMDRAHGRGIVFEVHSVKYYSTYHMVDILAFGATILRLSALNAAELVKVAVDPHDPQTCSTCIFRHNEQSRRAAQSANVKLGVLLDVESFQEAVERHRRWMRELGFGVW